MLDRGAVMGAVHGWERPNWFSDVAGDVAVPSFRRSNWFAPVARECAAVSGAVGLADMSVFAKFDITGPQAHAFVDTLGANRAPRPGRINLTHALSPAGGTEAEFTVSCLSDTQFYLTSAAAAEDRDEDLLRARSAGFDVEIRRISEEIGVLGLMGPKSRDVLAELTQDDPGPWLSVREISVAGIPVRALRVSYVGEMGWELHVAADRMKELFLRVETAAHPFGLRFFGAYAMNAMRLEKGYRAAGSDFTSERTPAETGAGHMIRMDHEFTGKEALSARMQADDRWEMVLLEVDSLDVDPFYAHGVYQDDICVGIVTSAAYGHRTGRTLALAYLRDRAARTGLSIEVLGERRSATILEDAPYDLQNTRLRGS